MRIQEMRSGFAHLRRKTDRIVVARQRLHVVPSPTIGENETKIALTPRCPLNENQWSVISSERVEAGGMTYSQAQQLLDALADSNMPGLCIVTDAAATRR